MFPRIDRFDPARVVSIDDLRQLARRRLPHVLFEYVEGGAESELTLRENSGAFHEICLRPKAAMAFPKIDLSVEVLGHKIAMPLMVAPVGYNRLMHPQGEIAGAKAAGDAGTAFILSTVSGYRLEDVRSCSKGPLGYQLYLLGGREAAESAVERARLAGFDFLVITVDTAIAGHRERDLRNGVKQLLGNSLWKKLPFIPDILRHAGWFVQFVADGGLHGLANIVVPGEGPMQLPDVPTALKDCAITWQDIRRIRQIWAGPIVVKGILTGEDGRRAVDEGADAVVVSNHGGRQLDSVSATIRALPEVVSAVNGQIEVWMDGGIRRGSDVIKAVCLGARAVLVGRAYAYGLAAGGRDGVGRALEIFREDLERTLRLLGCPSISELQSSYVEVPRTWNK